MFTTKPVGADRKLYKTIDKQFDALIESHNQDEPDDTNNHNSDNNHEIIPPNDEFLQTRRRFSTSSDNHGLYQQPNPVFRGRIGSFDQSSTSPRPYDNDSPFGPLNNSTSRRTFAYLIGILNSSYPDNDFSSLEPSNFSKVNFQSLKAKFENTLISLGKQQSSFQFIWDLVDQHMELKNSNFYELITDDAFEFEDEETSVRSLWQYKWFIFNKKKKRVAFLYLNGLRLQSPKLYPNGDARQRRLTIDNDLDEEEYDLTYDSDNEKKFKYQDEDVFEGDDEDAMDYEQNQYIPGNVQLEISH